MSKIYLMSPQTLGMSINQTFRVQFCVFPNMWYGLNFHSLMFPSPNKPITITCRKSNPALTFINFFLQIKSLTSDRGEYLLLDHCVFQPSSWSTASLDLCVLQRMMPSLSSTPKATPTLHDPMIQGHSLKKDNRIFKHKSPVVDFDPHSWTLSTT